MSDERLLGCLLPRGSGIPLLSRLAREQGIVRAEVHSARGFMGSDPRRLLNRVEKDLLTILVEGDRADEIFTWIYHVARVSEVEGRFLYMTRVLRTTPYRLPEGVAAEHG